MGTRSEEGETTAEDVVDALGKELAKQKGANEELLTRLKYLQADFENYRKRMDKELKEAGESQLRGLISRLLVVQDELDLAAKHAAGEKGEGDTLKEGVSMVRRNLKTALESVGLERIESVGKPFDPTLHDAVEKVQGDSCDQDVVTEEIRPGFTFRGTLLRPSLVKVELAAKVAEEEKEIE